VGEPESVIEQVLRNLLAAREAANIDAGKLEEELILGPDWVSRFETGHTIPDLNTFLVLVDRIGVDPQQLFSDIRNPAPLQMVRSIYGVPSGNDVMVHFTYANHDATYLLKNATVEQFDEVLRAMRDGLATLVEDSESDDDVQSQIKTNAVVSAFMKAISFWPKANPSDIWWFIIYRAYCDPFNHPAEYARLSFEQSWKRTSGWALEEIFVRHYRDELLKHGISMEIANGERKRQLAAAFNVPVRIESDKVDIFLSGPDNAVFGVVHVKASFAERRTDDVPMSEALIKAGYYSPLCTMDCKSSPSVKPANRGELGGTGANRSAKRKDIEDDGWFSACFSYNSNTIPTPKGKFVKAPVICCDFSNPDDEFVARTVSAWRKFEDSGRKQ